MTRSGRPAARVALAVVALAVALVVSACGDDDKGAAPTITSAAGKRGQTIARDEGCTSCHSANGSRSTGPTWKDLAGSEVKLSDGTTVTADDAYLAQSITDPRSQVVKGYVNIMPTTYADLSTAEVADLVAYLNELSTKTS